MNPIFDPEIETGNFGPALSAFWPPGSIRVVVWNIDRGSNLSRITEFLTSTRADLILLQECDLNARRTNRLNIAREIARNLQMNYVFGREFQELSQGSSDSPAYHGQATLSRWPISNPRIMRFTKQSDFWRPRWFLPDVEPFQERLGGRMALVTEVNAGGRKVVAYNLHLESRGDDRLRNSQLRQCVDDAVRYVAGVPIVIAGDFNMDLSHTTGSDVLLQARFSSAFPNRPARTTPGSILERGRPIDWIFTRGRVRSNRAFVHTSVNASDHFPLSVQLTFG